MNARWMQVCERSAASAAYTALAVVTPAGPFSCVIVGCAALAVIAALGSALTDDEAQS